MGSYTVEAEDSREEVHVLVTGFGVSTSLLIIEAPNHPDPYHSSHSANLGSIRPI